MKYIFIIAVMIGMGAEAQKRKVFIPLVYSTEVYVTFTPATGLWGYEFSFIKDRIYIYDAIPAPYIIPENRFPNFSLSA